jgi:hypothetical protein
MDYLSQLLQISIMQLNVQAICKSEAKRMSSDDILSGTRKLDCIEFG